MAFDTDLDYAAMTWEEAEEAFETADLLVLPTGSTEQHSLHLPLATDALVASWMARELAAHGPEYDLRMRVLPTLPYGYSEHHMNFAGTVTLSPHTFESVVVDIGASLARHGADRLLVVNAHGGNDEPLKLAADRLEREHGLAVHFHPTDRAVERLAERFGEDWGHAGDYETSLMEYIHPELVCEERKREQTRHETAETRQDVYFDDLTEEGARGDPTNSDPEFVAEVVEDAVDDILEQLRADLDLSSEE